MNCGYIYFKKPIRTLGGISRQLSLKRYMQRRSYCVPFISTFQCKDNLFLSLKIHSHLVRHFKQPKTPLEKLSPEISHPIGLDPQLVIDRVNQHEHAPPSSSPPPSSILLIWRTRSSHTLGTPLITNSITHPLFAPFNVGRPSHSTVVKIFNDHRSIFTN